MFFKLIKGFSHVVCLSFLLVSSFFISTAQAATWSELGDAGELLGMSQTPTGSGSLTSISGTISQDSDIDLYKIYISDPTSFSAIVSGGNGFIPEFGGDGWDSVIALFDQNGYGVYFGDDFIDGNGQAGLPANHLYGPRTAGIYYLAISDDAWAPLSGSASSASDLIFPVSVFPFTDILGPTSPGGNSALTGWGRSLIEDNPLDNGGTYSVALTGVSPVPEPETYAMFMAGLGLMGFIARRRKQKEAA